MSEAKTLMIIVGSILLLGILFTNIAGNFTNTEDLNDTWISDVGIDTMGGSIVDIGKYTVSSVTWLAESVGNLFGLGERQSITIDGTGEYDTETFIGNISLDGEYEEYENHPYSADRVFENSIRTSIISSEVAQIRVNYSNENSTIPDEAWIIVDYLGRDYEDRVYEATDSNSLSWYGEWDLYDNGRNLTWNDKAYGDAEEIEEISTSTTDKVRSFFDETKESVKNSIRTFGLIPQEIGLPILIIFLIGLIYLIIKALPWT